MKPHYQLTIFRSQHRVRELREFRDTVEAYFAQSEPDPTGLPVDWEAAQATRARINRMLPRILQIARAAGLGSEGTPTDPGLPLVRVDVLQRIFAARYADGTDQEVLDVLDMALGVYESGRAAALLRTVNPLHYAATAFSWLMGLPRRALAALGLGGGRAHRLRAADIDRLQAVAERLANVEDLIERRLAAAHDRQAQRQAETSRQVAELAERLDFAERVLAGQRPPLRLERVDEGRITTPV